MRRNYLFLLFDRYIKAKPIKDNLGFFFFFFLDLFDLLLILLLHNNINILHKFIFFQYGYLPAAKKFIKNDNIQMCIVSFT